MNMQIALGSRGHQAGLPEWLGGRLLRPLGAVLAMGLAFGLLWVALPEADALPDGAANGQLVHWQDVGHDWLLVVEPGSQELVVYDANDGRPLGRFGADDGLPPVQSIRGQGALVAVSGAGRQARWLKLPELELVSR